MSKLLDVILIQHIESGTNLLEYRQEETQFKSDHADIFSGFMSAIKGVMSGELNIGSVVLISTDGEKGHNCIIVSKPPIENSSSDLGGVTIDCKIHVLTS